MSYAPAKRSWSAALVAVAAACTTAQPPTAIPPANPSHHAVVVGVVVGSSGQPLAGIGVGVRFAASAPRERQMSVWGGSATDAKGSYSFDIHAFKPTAADAMVDVFVHALKSGPPGGRLVTDSILTRVRLAPLAEKAPVTEAPVVRLPLSR
jgi:hypothetical protein